MFNRIDVDKTGQLTLDQLVEALRVDFLGTVAMMGSQTKKKRGCGDPGGTEILKISDLFFSEKNSLDQEKLGVNAWKLGCSTSKDDPRCSKRRA